VGGTSGRESGPLPTFKTSMGQTYFSYVSGAIADGVRNRASAATFYYNGSVGAFAEYTRSAQVVAKSGVGTDVANDGWDVTGSFVLTGERTSDRGVRPRANFDPSAGHWGALQVIGRYSALRIDPAAFAAGLAGATASRDTRAFDFGINWYLTPYIRYYATVEFATFDGGAATRPVERGVIFRAQLAF
jgi:phosphate-selective porin OprO/OprP